LFAVGVLTSTPGLPLLIEGFTEIIGVTPSLPGEPVDPGEPVGPGEPLSPLAPAGITNVNLFEDELHETDGLAPAEVGDAVTVEIGAVSSSSHTTPNLLLASVKPETFLVSLQLLIESKDIVDPKIPEGMTIEN
jgi:hypothetical protein